MLLPFCIIQKNYKKIVAGYIINCVGHGNEVTYKKSRIGDTLSDHAALNVITNSNYNYKIVDFDLMEAMKDNFAHLDLICQ